MVHARKSIQIILRISNCKKRQKILKVAVGVDRYCTSSTSHVGISSRGDFIMMSLLIGGLQYLFGRW